MQLIQTLLHQKKWLLAGLGALVLTAAPASLLMAAGKEKPQKIDYSFTPPAPQNQTWDAAEAKSSGCVSCHTDSDQKTMHETPAVVLGCVDCHGGDAAVTGDNSWGKNSLAYMDALKKAHVLPKYPESWHWPSSANPKRSYALLNKESPEFVRFVNPSDYRVAREACGACHMEIIEASERSLMATGAMLWGGAAYNNGIVPFKNYVFGEAYTRKGEGATIKSPGNPHGTVTEEQKKRGALPILYPLPTWHTIPPGDIFRVFERGGRNINTQFPEIGLPNIGGIIQRLEEPGRPDLKQSNRGPGTGLRVAIPALNIHKTRLNDPFMWFMGTNDQPGDYRQSGCAGCHVVYANDREPRHSLIWAKYGRDGQTQTVDPTIRNLKEGEHRTGSYGTYDAAHGKKGKYGGKDDHAGKAAGNDDGHGDDHSGDIDPAKREKGHPIKHTFTRAIPTAQCMNCHMHQPNIFLNSYLGYTMWDYESDAPYMWPGPDNKTPRPEGMSDEEYAKIYKTQKFPTAEEVRKVLDRNPEGAAPKGLWADIDFLRNVYDLNSELKDTQFADYHGHGWNFRAILKRDREGNLLDADGDIIDNDDPEKFRREEEEKFVKPGINPGKSVHMMSIHAEVGMQCADCHFAQDSHGNGLIYGEVANAVEISCKDCHGTADAYPTLKTSNLAARPKGKDLALLRNADGQRRFEWMQDPQGNRVLIQRSIVDPELSWRVSLVKDSVDRDHPDFNMKAARSKLMSKTASETGKYSFGTGIAAEDRAHKDDNMVCFTCHLSWTTSCGGCHLPIEANWQAESHRYEGGTTRNYATYNPQVARDQMFQLGLHQTTKGNIIAPVRSTSALVLSSTNINRERIYVQQPPISAIGYSSQAFAPHFPHTVRKTETKQCSDCHLSEANDNNAIMSQLLLQGTNFVNFVGLHAWVGLEKGFEAVRVTEWDEPQAVIGSYLQKYAYPDYWRMHVEDNDRELINWVRGKTLDGDLSGETKALEEFANVVQGTGDAVRCLQLRGEYMFVAEGKGGFRAYDVASIGNKGFSERIVKAPFSSLGHDTHVDTKNATCMALATNQPIAPTRNTKELREINEEQPFHPIYNYAVITDSEEGLVLVDVNTLADGEFRNNFFKRAATWNEGNVLAGARHITLAGHYAYIAAASGLVVIDLDDPLKPRHVTTVPMTDARASAIQFRYLWVTDTDGVKLFDVTDMENPVAVESGTIPLANAQRLYLARTYAYIAAKNEGLVIANITRPEAPVIYRKETFGGQMNDAEDVIVGSTNATLFAYVADGRNGLKVIQLTSPDSQPNYYGFSPPPVPELIAFARTPKPALALSKGLDRDRAVDETGGQMAIFGRIGSRPFNRSEMQRFYLNKQGKPYFVKDAVDMADWVGAKAPPKIARR
ncbi:LVIVD repeat-containing protein [Parasphingorhabdus marina DSM 22363]|uniref:LVIVD repeat-containing protein n=1 Tax=Parasphingorhabdus marina DSM 22363 TaxID=1123272 RepID=A0A1N6GZQ6_9SPHN|nr:LVIVD repeat-containing protein [Parasphingorhabdus marina DSM 22363]